MSVTVFQFYCLSSAEVGNFDFYFLEYVRHSYGIVMLMCVMIPVCGYLWVHPSCCLDFDLDVLWNALSVLTERQKLRMIIVEEMRGLGRCDFSTEKMGVYF